MNIQKTFSRIAAITLAAGALVFVSMPGSSASALGVGELQECTISKSADVASAPDGDETTNSADYGTWQRRFGQSY